MLRSRLVVVVAVVAIPPARASRRHSADASSRARGVYLSVYGIASPSLHNAAVALSDGRRPCALCSYAVAGIIRKQPEANLAASACLSRDTARDVSSSFDLAATRDAIGSSTISHAIEGGASPDALQALMIHETAAFQPVRQRHLRY